MKNKYYKFFYRYCYWVFGVVGLCIPPIILYSVELRVKKLERGVINDLERIEKSGRKFSDIPKTF
jgi:hypothetical protein